MKGGFTCVEAGIVAAIILLFAAIAYPSFVRAREEAIRRKNGDMSLGSEKIGEIGSFEIHRFDYSGEKFCVAIPKTNSVALERP